MSLPLFILAPNDLGIPELIDYIVVIITKSLAEQSLDVFEHEGNRLYLPDCPNRFREKVSRVGVTTVLSSQ
jgi:hypothetical protein